METTRRRNIYLIPILSDSAKPCPPLATSLPPTTILTNIRTYVLLISKPYRQVTTFTLRTLLSRSKITITTTKHTIQANTYITYQVSTPSIHHNVEVTQPCSTTYLYKDNSHRIPLLASLSSCQQYSNQQTSLFTHLHSHIYIIASLPANR